MYRAPSPSAKKKCAFRFFSAAVGYFESKLVCATAPALASCPRAMNDSSSCPFGLGGHPARKTLEIGPPFCQVTTPVVYAAPSPPFHECFIFRPRLSPWAGRGKGVHKHRVEHSRVLDLQQHKLVAPFLRPSMCRTESSKLLAHFQTPSFVPVLHGADIVERRRLRIKCCEFCGKRGQNRRFAVIN